MDLLPQIIRRTRSALPVSPARHHLMRPIDPGASTGRLPEGAKAVVHIRAVEENPEPQHGYGFRKPGSAVPSKAAAACHEAEQNYDAPAHHQPGGERLHFHGIRHFQVP